MFFDISAYINIDSLSAASELQYFSTWAIKLENSTNFQLSRLEKYRNPLVEKYRNLLVEKYRNPLAAEGESVSLSRILM
jgi:hypothetical protein